MKLTIMPNPNQHEVVNLPNPLGPRTYKIRFNAISGHKLGGHLSEVARATDESVEHRTFNTSALIGLLAV